MGIGLAIAILSILWVELVRDFYHALSHVWQPLYRLHVWHHKVFRRDLSIISETVYRQAHWYNDVPESLVMLLFSILPWSMASIWEISPQWAAGTGTLYTFSFLVGAIARGCGVPMADEITDVTHRPGEFVNLPSRLFVNRPYHWRHHFDNQDAYFSGTLTFVDKFLGTALSLKNKRIAVTGASGTLARALMAQLHLAGAKVTALTSSGNDISLDILGENIPITTISWQIGQEHELLTQLDKIDILIINHGVNVHGQRDEDAIAKSYEINTFSVLRLMESFFRTIKSDRDMIRKELWVNTSEAEVNPAFSPLYELSKRTTGDIVTMRRLDAPCIIRKLILGPFKSKLNPVGILSSDWVAEQIINLACRDIRNIIVTINPLTFILFPLKEFCVANYYRWFTLANKN